MVTRNVKRSSLLYNKEERFFSSCLKEIESSVKRMALINLNQVSKEFSGKNGTVSAVSNVNFTVEEGEIFGIVGYSGAGKSTLVRLLNGLEAPSSGQVLIDQQDVAVLSGKKLREFRKEIGMIFQHFNLLWSRTVIENIALPLELSRLSRRERENKALDLIKLVGLEGREDAYPSQLSGGQKQRVGIARALANDPKILLCDEGTSALDPQTTDEVLELLASINQKLGLTIVLITHEMHVIRKICHKVAVMEKGKIVEQGDVLEVFSNPQQEVTKRFVQQETVPETRSNPDALNFLAESFTAGKIVQLTFEGHKARSPIISKVIRHCQVDVNVIQGQIHQTQTSSFGTLIIELTGAEEEIEQAIRFFKEEGVGVEVGQE